mmetsp:Transcript_33844/g.108180  ORF Transcript_33844/g.108180 Transcript_33844/m.108180 type:complete len:215 (+) Transcript_33844:825-1469(+)
MAWRPGASMRQKRKRGSSSAQAPVDEEPFVQTTSPSTATDWRPESIFGTPTRATVPAGTSTPCRPAVTSNHAPAASPSGVGTLPLTHDSALLLFSSLEPTKCRGTASQVRNLGEVGVMPRTDSVSHAVMPALQGWHSLVRMSLIPPMGGSPGAIHGSHSGSKRSQKHVAPTLTFQPHVRRVSSSAASVRLSASSPSSVYQELKADHEGSVRGSS